MTKVCEGQSSFWSRGIKPCLLECQPELLSQISAWLKLESAALTSKFMSWKSWMQCLELKGVLCY